MGKSKWSQIWFGDCQIKTTITAQELTYFYFNLSDFAKLQKLPYKTLNVILHLFLKWDLCVKSQSLDVFQMIFVVYFFKQLTAQLSRMIINIQEWSMSLSLSIKYKQTQKKYKSSEQIIHLNYFNTKFNQ